MEARKVPLIPWSSSYMWLWATRYGYWEPNFSPLQKDQMLSILNLLSKTWILCKISFPRWLCYNLKVSPWIHVTSSTRVLDRSLVMSLGNLGFAFLTSCAISFKMVHSVLGGRRETHKITWLWNFRKLKDSCPHTGFTPVISTEEGDSSVELSQIGQELKEYNFGEPHPMLKWDFSVWHHFP